MNELGRQKYTKTDNLPLFRVLQLPMKYFILPFSSLFLWLSTLNLVFALNLTDVSSFTICHDSTLFSSYLNRKITLDIVLPPNYNNTKHSYRVLYMNDGQDLKRLEMTQVLANTKVEPFVLVAIHCGDRLQEYGTAAQADYKQRGAKAAAYTQFVLKELLPHIQQKYRVLTGPANTFFCGFSLGGLSAFDIVWHNSAVFGKAGVFSGSFWWRQKADDDNYHDDQDRIMHKLVRQSAPILATHRPQFWFQTGSEDEKDDRNHNGIIDSIEDTLDLIAELEKKGYRWNKDLRYVEIAGGHHDPATWSRAMPDFLKWLFF